MVARHIPSQFPYVLLHVLASLALGICVLLHGFTSLAAQMLVLLHVFAIFFFCAA